MFHCRRFACRGQGGRVHGHAIDPSSNPASTADPSWCSKETTASDPSWLPYDCGLLLPHPPCYGFGVVGQAVSLGVVVHAQI